VLLAKQGKLQLDDDIHKYLSWFPDLKEKDHHPKSFKPYQWYKRSMAIALAISGTRIDDVITQGSYH
jgi:CubicO group peptidase (beta-lactamase class C family)